MRIFLKLVSLLLCIVMVGSAFAACHGRGVIKEGENGNDGDGNVNSGDINGTGNLADNGVDFDTTVKFDETKSVEITFWAKNDNNATQVEIYKKAIADFEAIYPNVKVNFKPYSDYNLIYQDVITNIQTKTTPNVCISYPDHIATYMQGVDIMVKLDSLMEDEEYGFGGSKLKFDSPKREEVVEKFLEEGKIGGAQFAMPFMRSTEACYINKNYVEALGYTIPDVLTWDFIWEVSEAAMAKNSDGTYVLNGQKTMIPFIYKSTDNMMISMLKQKGAGYSTSAAEIQIFNDTTRDILFEVAKHAGTRAFSTFKISSYPGNYLNAGQCVFAIDSTAGATWMGTDAPLIDIHKEEVVDFETVVRPIPQYDVENPKMISQGPSVCIFNKEDEQEVWASWLFVQYLMTNEVQIAYAQTEGYLPVTHKALDSAEYKDYISRSGENNDLYYNVKIDASKILMDNIDNTFVTPVFAGSASLRDAAGQLIEEVVKARRRKKTVDDEFIDNLFSEMTTLFKLDQVRPIEIATEPKNEDAAEEGSNTEIES